MGLILLIMLLYGLLQLPYVQTRLAKQVATNLSRQLGAEVSVTGINMHFFDKIDLKGLLVRDRQKDTLLYGGTEIGRAHV